MNYTDNPIATSIIYAICGFILGGLIAWAL